MQHLPRLSHHAFLFTRLLRSVLVAIGGKERYIGESAVPHMRSNYSNTITQIKRLIGRKFSEPDVQAEIQNFLGFRVVQLPDDEIGVEVRWRGV